MILLDSSKYDIVIRPLQEVTINKLFARSVVEKKVIGTVYVDNINKPGTFYVVHPYGMSLLFGDIENEGFNSAFLDYALNRYKLRVKAEWLQVFPDAWNTKLSDLFGANLIKVGDISDNTRDFMVEESTRVNFKFNKGKYLYFRSKLSDKGYKTIRTDMQLYEEMQGTVVPKYFWNDASAFCNYGVGFSMIYDKRVVSTAYSAYIHDNLLELGIETVESYRGRGFALFTCSSLIDYCIEHYYEPVWSCRMENTGSYKLAQVLGFEPTAYFPYYRLK